LVTKIKINQNRHIVGGYSAGYYGYLWSKVYSCDMFDKFKSDGLLNKETGRKYRKYILATGGTRDSMDALVDFLGREPNSNAFLKDIGVHQ
jgi:Zn-dependent oligopeptidase